MNFVSKNITVEFVKSLFLGKNWNFSTVCIVFNYVSLAMRHQQIEKVHQEDRIRSELGQDLILISRKIIHFQDLSSWSNLLWNLHIWLKHHQDIAWHGMARRAGGVQNFSQIQNFQGGDDITILHFVTPNWSSRALLNSNAHVWENLEQAGLKSITLWDEPTNILKYTKIFFFQYFA